MVRDLPGFRQNCQSFDANPNFLFDFKNGTQSTPISPVRTTFFGRLVECD